MEQFNILQQVLTYFSKFPDRPGVLKNFEIINGSEAYKSFKESIEQSTQHSLLPDIKDYVFGASDKAVMDKIQSLKNVYLFVDYGAVSTRITDLDVSQDQMDFAITIAKTGNGNAQNSIEELILMDSMLNMIGEIKNTLRKDRDDPFVRMINKDFDIVPFFSDKLYNSYGWTLIFKINGVEII